MDYKILSLRTGVDVADCKKLLPIVVETIGRLASEGETINIPGFGCFRPKMREERVGTLPGETKRMLLPPRLILTFIMNGEGNDNEPKVSLPALARDAAATADLNAHTLERFIRTLFNIVAEELKEGKVVKVPGLGTFKPLFTEDTLIRVSFVADKEIAETVNSPFSFFEPVECNLEEEPEPEIEEKPEAEPEPAIVEKENKQEEPEAIPAPLVTETVTTLPHVPEVEWADEEEETEEVPQEEAEAEEFEQKEASEVTPQEVAPIQETSELETVEEFDSRTTSRSGYKFCWGFALGFIAAAIIVGVCYLILNNNSSEKEAVLPVNVADAPPIPEDIETPIITPEELATDTVKKEEAAPTAPSKQAPVYDTISKTRYLTTMAKQHYGNYHLWSYIYDANANLGHPDRIKPGTRILIPDLKSQGIDPTSQEIIEKAKRRGVEIYKRFK